MASHEKKSPGAFVRIVLPLTLTRRSDRLVAASWDEGMTFHHSSNFSLNIVLVGLNHFSASDNDRATQWCGIALAASKFHDQPAIGISVRSRHYPPLPFADSSSTATIVVRETVYSVFYSSINPLLSVFFCQSSRFTSQTSLRVQESSLPVRTVSASRSYEVFGRTLCFAR